MNIDKPGLKSHLKRKADSVVSQIAPETPATVAYTKVDRGVQTDEVHKGFWYRLKKFKQKEKMKDTFDAKLYSYNTTQNHSLNTINASTKYPSPPHQPVSPLH